MKKCPNCGTRMGDKARFCSGCGTSLEEAVSAVPKDEEVKESSADAEIAPDRPVTESTQEQPGGEPQKGPGFTQEQYHQAPPNQTPPPHQYRPPYQAYDPKDHTSEFDPADIADNKLFAAMPYFFGLAGVIAALLIQGSPFTRFHIKNEIRFLIASLIACIPFLVPFLGWAVSAIALTVLAALKVIAMIYVLQGKAKEIPIISSISFLT